MRIAIVNDLGMAVEALRRVVALRPEHQVAWVAQDGVEAVARCRADRPDLILMDLVMPRMDGAEATRRIMAETPCAILVVTASVGANMGLVFQAMGAGALDAVKTPVLGADGRPAGAVALLGKIEMIGRLLGGPIAPAASTAAPAASTGAGEGVVSVVLGASTGGPAAVDAILGALPGDLDAAFVLVQHVDAEFAADLAAWLSRRSPYPVAVAPAGCRPAARRVWLAGTGEHLVLAADGTLQYRLEADGAYYRPSVDVFFQSVAAHHRTPGVAVLLTGMGRDGAVGLAALRQAGWHTICQDEATSVVFGMPRAAIQAGAAMEVLALSAIAPAVTRACREAAVRRAG